MKLLILLLISLLGLVLADSKLAQKAPTCFTSAGKCVPSKARVTKLVWNDCEHYCKSCKGLSVGKCEKVNTKSCIGGYQCKCKGAPTAKSEELQVRATCRLGLTEA